MDGYSTKHIREELFDKELGGPRGADSNRGEAVVASEKTPAITTFDWNVEELLERVDGDRQFMRELLGMFRDDSESAMKRARMAESANDMLGLSRAAHSMKGMLKNLAMGKGAGIAGALEEAAHDEKLIESKELLTTLELALEQVLLAVQAQLNELKV